MTDMPEPAGAGWQADDAAGTSGGQLDHGGREQVSNVSVVPALTLTASGAWATHHSVYGSAGALPARTAS